MKKHDWAVKLFAAAVLAVLVSFCLMMTAGCIRMTIYLLTHGPL